MGISFVKGRVMKITDDGKGRGDVILRVEDVENGVVKKKHTWSAGGRLRPQNLIVENSVGVPELVLTVTSADPMVNPP